MAVGMTHGPELGTVVAGVDGSRPAERAVFWAAAEAVWRDGTLHLVHGADTDSRMLYASMYAIEWIRRAGRDLLEETAAKVAERHPGLHVSTELSPHEPVAGLHAAAADSDTIVVGSRGLGGFESLMLGSVGLKVAAGAKAPVVVVRGTRTPPKQGSCWPPSVTNMMWSARGTRRVRRSCAGRHCGCCTSGMCWSPWRRA